MCLEAPSEGKSPPHPGHWLLMAQSGHIPETPDNQSPVEHSGSLDSDGLSSVLPFEKSKLLRFFLSRVATCVRLSKSSHLAQP